MSEDRGPHPPIARSPAMEWIEVASPRRGTRFEVKRVAAAAGGRELGASLYRIPAGGRSWPFHWHAGNEEGMWVVAGRGTLRLGAERHSIEAGDWIALPVGPAHAHQLVNDSPAELVVLCVSTMREPDIAYYPESGKVGLFPAGAPGRPPPPEMPRSFLDAAAERGYWDGEEGAIKDSRAS